MKRTARKLLGLLLALALCLSLLPMAAMAKEAEPEGPYVKIFGWTVLDGDTIEKDCDEEQGWSFAKDATGDGYTLTLTDAQVSVVEVYNIDLTIVGTGTIFYSEGEGFEMYNGDLTIGDSKTATDITFNGYWYGIYVDGGDVTITNSTVNANAAGGCGILADDGEVTITGSTVNATVPGDSIDYNYGIYADEDITVTNSNVTVDQYVPYVPDDDEDTALRGSSSDDEAGYPYAGIFAYDGEVMIKDSSTVNTVGGVYGINAYGPVTIDKSKVIAAAEGDVSYSGYYDYDSYPVGIFSFSAVDIKNGSDVTATGASAGIQAYPAPYDYPNVYEASSSIGGTVSIANSKVNATATGDDDDTAYYSDEAIYAGILVCSASGDYGPKISAVTETLSAGAEISITNNSDVTAAGEDVGIFTMGSSGMYLDIFEKELAVDVFRSSEDNGVASKAPMLIRASDPSTVTISGSKVTATGDSYAGIGMESTSMSDTLNISKSTVTAEGRQYGITVCMPFLHIIAPSKATTEEAPATRAIESSLVQTADILTDTTTSNNKINISNSTVTATGEGWDVRDVKAFSPFGSFGILTSGTLAIEGGSTSGKVTADGADLAILAQKITLTKAKIVEPEGGEVDKLYDEENSPVTIYDEDDVATHAVITIEGGGSGGPSGGPSSTTYKVNILDTQNGSVTSSEKQAAAGAKVTLTVKADDGYQIDAVTVTEKNGKAIDLTDKGNGSYTFTMPNSDVNVKATFAANIDDPDVPLDPGEIFEDVEKEDYFHDPVYWALEKGITNGTDPTHFSPDMACTRAQMVTFLWRAIGEPAATEGTVNPFVDSIEGEYYYDAVLWATETGVTLGTSETTFSPDQTVTRCQAVTFLYRYMGEAIGDANPFEDVSADAYYYEAVLWAVDKGITNGTSDTTFSPDDDCLRSQIVTFLYRAMAL